MKNGESKRGVTLAEARAVITKLDGVVAGRSYGLPSFLVNGKFFARFRDDDTVLVLRVASIDERELLMSVDQRAFFFTDHYRNHPAVLIRLAEVPRDLLGDVIAQAWRSAMTAKPAARKRRKTT